MPTPLTTAPVRLPQPPLPSTTHALVCQLHPPSARILKRANLDPTGKGAFLFDGWCRSLRGSYCAWPQIAQSKGNPSQPGRGNSKRGLQRVSTRSRYDDAGRVRYYMLRDEQEDLHHAIDAYKAANSTL